MDAQQTSNGWAGVTLELPADTPLAVIGGKWRRLGSGRILATYTREELALVIQLAEAINNESQGRDGSRRLKEVGDADHWGQSEG